MSETYASGNKPTTIDTRRSLLVKWLNSLQCKSGASAHNNPERTDTVRTLIKKIDQAKAGI